MAKNKKIEKANLAAMIDQELRSSIGYIGGETSEDRRKAMEFYLGEPFGNEQEDRSQFVSTDVQDVIESMMPDLMELFASGDQLVRFTPTGPEDEAFAKQATDYINHIWMNDNDGYVIIHDWVKDGLLQKNGIIKQYWDNSDHKTNELMEGLNSLQLQALQGDDSVEIIELTEIKEATEEELQYAPDGLLYDVRMVRTTPRGRLKIVGLPPEEFLISRRSVSLEEASFTCHKVKKTISEMLEMGFTQEELDDLPSHDTQDFNEERVARFRNDDEWPDWENNLDPTMREVWLYDCYIKVDYDGDGIAEMNQVFVAGRGYYLLKNPDSGEWATPVDDHPFNYVTPIKMPHKFFGISMADLTMDIQMIKSTIERNVLDNAYLINNARSAVNDRVDLDDYLSGTPGGTVSVDGEGPVGDAIQQIITQPLGPVMFDLLEYMDQTKEERTGINRLSQGLDPNAMSRTATGTNLLMGRSQRKLLFIARTMAEIGFIPAFKKSLKLVITHQDRKRVIRLRNEWVEMDPRHWNAEMDASVEVALGAGTKQDQIGMVGQLLALQEKVIQAQGGLEGPLVTWNEVHHAASKLTNASGFKDTELFFLDPPQDYQAPQREDPEMAKVQAQAQMDQAKLESQQKLEAVKIKGVQEMNAASIQQKQQEAQVGAQLAEQKANAEITLKREVAAAELKLKRETIEAELSLKRQELEAELNLKQAELGIKETEVHLDHQLKESQLEKDASKEKSNGAAGPVQLHIGGDGKKVAIDNIAGKQLDGMAEASGKLSKSMDASLKSMAGSLEKSMKSAASAVESSAKAAEKTAKEATKATEKLSAVAEEIARPKKLTVVRGRPGTVNEGKIVGGAVE